MSYDLRWYQTEAHDAAWQFLCSQPGNPVVVLPTGAGKSLVIAALARTAVERFKGRVIVLANRKELLEQNAEKVRALLPLTVSVGFYSAGLRRFDDSSDVIVAGIQSVYKKASLFGERHLVIPDEAHLVPDGGEGMYQTFLKELRSINPKLRAVGMTATPYRTDSGALVGPNRVFQRICYSASVPRLIGDGFLAPITNKIADGQVDTSKISIHRGEFDQGEMERAFDGAEKVTAACREIVAKTAGRGSILLFCSGVNHAGHVAETIQRMTGERVALITGGTLPIERATAIAAFKSRELRWVVNVDVLTTGFDAPCVDAIAVLRATQSAGLFAQMAGRGFRLAAGKADCLLLDFGENIARHGPLDSPSYGTKAVETRESAAKPGDAPTKKCPNCETDCHLSARECLTCGWRFPDRELKHGETADTTSHVLAAPEEWLVEEVHLSRHRKAKGGDDAPNTLRVDYVCQPANGEAGNLTSKEISEWVCIEHEPGSIARKKAGQWFRDRCAMVPGCIDEALSLWARGAIAQPRSITTVRDGHFYRIIGAILDPVPAPEEWTAPRRPDDGEPVSVGWEVQGAEDIPF